MANGKNLELALRIRADLQAGVKALDDLEQSVVDVGEAAKKTDQELGKVNQETSAQTTANDRLTASENKLTAAIRQANSELSARSSLSSSASAALPAAMGAGIQPAGASVVPSRAAPTILPSATDTKKATDAINAHEEALRTAGVSAKQYQQAMRMLPMQLTDVVTSLSSGMPVWMVAIQQGGQIKDSFGGIGAAAQAVISAINPMTAAIAAAAAVTVGLVAAHEAGANEQRRFNETLILTGNYAGVTAGQLAAMSREIADIKGVTQGSAAAALNEVASRGKFTADQIQLVAAAAERMRIATGKSVEQTADEFEKLAEKPLETILELNKSQHFLTDAQLEQIRTLKSQQGEQAAATAAMQLYDSVITERAPQITQNLGTIERAWEGLKRAAAGAIDGAKSIGRPLDDVQLGTQLTQRIAYLQSTLGTGFEPFADTQGEIDKLTASLDRLNARQQAAAKATKATVDSAAEAARQAAADSFVKGSESQLQSLQKLTDVERARQIMQKQGITENSTLGQSMLQAAQATDRQRASNEAATEAEREANKARREAEQAAKSAAREAEQLAKQQEHYVVGLERQATTLGKTSAETRAYDLAEKGLTGALLARAQAALAATDAQEQLRQATADDKQLAEIQAQILSAQGRGSEAAAIQMEQQYGELLKRLTARGDTAGVALVDSLVNTQVVKAKFDELQQQFDRVMNERSRREQSVQAQQQAGLIGESEARRQILQIYQETSGELDDLVAKMEALANASGNPELVEMVRRLRGELERSKQQVDEFAIALREGLTDGIQESFKGLIKGTMSFKESISNIFESIGDSLLNALSRRVADNSADTIMGILGFATGQQGQSAGNGIAAMAGQQVAAIQQVSMAQQAANTAMATSSVASANVAAAGQATAAATTTTAWTPAAITASIGSFGAAAAIGLAAVIAAMAFKAFKDGGHVTGPGTGTSDSIPARLSNNEFVTRAAVVTQPGALDFLDDFNRRGMVALGDYGTANHSTGGLAGTPAPSYPAPALPNGGQPADPSTNLSTTLKNSQNFYLVDDPDRVRDAAWDEQGVERMYISIQRDPQKFRNLINPRG